MKYAPILLFTYNRPKHTIKTIESLKDNILAIHSNLFIYSDGPKSEEDRHLVNEVRKFIYNITGFKEVKIIKRDINFGLSKNIINGVTEMCNKYGKVIVLEDDLITSPYFLNFMNDGIDLYHNKHNVSSIHGYVYPTSFNLPNNFFIKGADCWGWATWSSAWSHFEIDGAKLLKEIECNKLQKTFNFDNTFDYYQMLQDQVNGKNDSWAIRWYASTFLKNMYTLYPGKSLITNFGFDNTGTHSGKTKMFKQSFYNNKIIIKSIPIEQSKIAYNAFIKYFKKNKLYSSKFRRYIKKYIPLFIFKLVKKIY